MSEFNLKLLQKEHQPWADNNFGIRPKWHPLLGMVEEIGELEEAILNKNETEIKDSLGDIMVFMADFSNQMGFDLEDITFNKVRSTTFRNRTIIIGRICHSFLKMEQKIRGTEAEHKEKISNLLSELYENLHLFTIYTYKIGLLDIVEETWNKVKQRNWKKNSVTGN